MKPAKFASAIGYYPHGALSIRVIVTFAVDYDPERPYMDRETLGEASSFEILDRVPARILREISPEILAWADNQPLDSWDFEGADFRPDPEEVGA